MTGLWKNEVRLFFSKKNCILLLLSLCFVTAVFWKKYESDYSCYLDKERQELEKEEKAVEVWASRYMQDMVSLNEQYPEYANWLENMPEEEMEASEDEMFQLYRQTALMAKAWGNYHSSLKYLLILWDYPEENKEKIASIFEAMDEALFSVYEKGIDTGETGLYRRYPRDWNQRNLLRTAYKEAKREEPLIKNRPDGAFVVADTFCGSSIIGIFLLLLVLFLNYDIWAKDFEIETSRLLFTLPYSRSQIYFSRYFVRFLLTAAVVGGSILVLFGWGCIKYGTGFENFFTVYAPAMESFGFFSPPEKAFIAEDVVVSAASYLSKAALLFVVYLLFLYTCIQLLSFVAKNQMVTILISVVGFIMGISSLTASKESYMAGLNLFAYLQWDKLAEGSLGVSYGAALLLLLAGSAVLAVLGAYIAGKRENG